MTTFPAQRPLHVEATSRLYATMYRLTREVQLDPKVRALVDLRASQMNGCAFCIDMHWKDARADGVSDERLYSLDAWRENPFYSERERAALDLCESITFISESHVPDEIWERAAEWFAPDELAHLVFAITAVNAWNRLTITARTEPGHYKPVRHETAA